MSSHQQVLQDRCMLEQLDVLKRPRNAKARNRMGRNFCYVES